MLTSLQGDFPKNKTGYTRRIGRSMEKSVCEQTDNNYIAPLIQKNCFFANTFKGSFDEEITAKTYAAIYERVKNDEKIQEVS